MLAGHVVLVWGFKVRDLMMPVSTGTLLVLPKIFKALIPIRWLDLDM